MWKIISLSALLFVAQAAELNDVYGSWIQYAFYPVSTYVPVCIRYTFSKAPENFLCTCGGNNVTSVQMSLETDKDYIPGAETAPLWVVNTVEEVMPALALSCKCGDKEKMHAVARLVKDYLILYHSIPASMSYTRTEIEQNSASLFGKKVVPERALSDIMSNIDELKNRRGAMMCGTENFSGFVTDGNEVSPTD
uniref:Uncharacterized protein n=1 Tax=Heliothis virescens TaxID=7102 RepID=A0A2A4K3K2_HELVI